MSEHRSARRLRVIIDANVLISYLLGLGNPDSTIVRAVRIILSGRFDLVVPQQLLVEFRDSQFQPKHAGRLMNDDIEELIQVMLEKLASPVVPESSLELNIGRDPKDKYLLEAAIRQDVDILVSGDKDLLVLADVLELPRIMSPAEFVAEFGEPI